MTLLTFPGKNKPFSCQKTVVEDEGASLIETPSLDIAGERPAAVAHFVGAAVDSVV